jgi:hypothetical protein
MCSIFAPKPVCASNASQPLQIRHLPRQRPSSSVKVLSVAAI